jgi:spoIIIJ-associated protein
MTEQRTTLEIIGQSVDEAIEEGLEKLGLTQEEVEIRVIDEGTKGLFGLGSRQARVVLTVKETSDPVIVEEPSETIDIQSEEETSSSEIRPDEEADALSENEHFLKIAHDTVVDLLEKMKIDAEVTASFADDEEYRGIKPILVEIHGDDLSILIGRKAETLDALQYITSLIVGKELGRSVPLTVDVEGYRYRRHQQLKQLAHRIAEQVVQTGRSQALEPMHARERRIIHIELRNHPQVYTESAGEGDRRKVVVYPKE